MNCEIYASEITLTFHIFCNKELTLSIFKCKLKSTKHRCSLRSVCHHRFSFHDS